jgi:hypothetical protein
MSWSKGKDVYNQLIQSIVEHCDQAGDLYDNEEKVIGYAKYRVFEFVEALTVKNLTLIHVYLVYMSELKSDPLFPAYVYTGGDRIISVTRYLFKYIELELAKRYV